MACRITHVIRIRRAELRPTDYGKHESEKKFRNLQSIDGKRDFFIINFTVENVIQESGNNRQYSPIKSSLRFARGASCTVTRLCLRPDITLPCNGLFLGCDLHHHVSIGNFCVSYRLTLAGFFFSLAGFLLFSCFVFDFDLVFPRCQRFAMQLDHMGRKTYWWEIIEGNFGMGGRSISPGIWSLTLSHASVQTDYERRQFLTENFRCSFGGSVETIL